ncbi:hypothetical protein IV203_021059 [Nitzschia inconspicua]|uniref:DUF6824 domain-containing protein n=1 Tax=Nitzschia inconspicua TaxID=303405 RepID=A0A9K3KG51_9STRA|nr:hypothetical protein IV203_021059 [Nitzschia inconspicua]
MAPPTSPTPLSPYEKDGQEYGLVPKYVLRKKGSTFNGSGSSGSFVTPMKPRRNGDRLSTSPRATPLKGFISPMPPNTPLDNQSTHSQSTTMKDCDEEDVPRKTPQQINALLQETDALLARRWRVANLVDSPAYENDKRLLLAQEGYKSAKAANRIEEHWKTKLELFGPELVEKKIVLADMTREGKTEVAVEDGFVQILPTRDLGGRAVMFFQYDPALYSKQSKQFRRILFYMMATVLQDEETVKRGITLVVWNTTPKPWFDPFWNAYSKIAAPYQISKLHYCQEVQDVPYSVQERREKETDIRMHQGSLQECLHGLVVSYGIPSHFIPLTFDGQLDRKEHLRWVELRRRIESFTLPRQQNVVLVPAQSDVLLGKRKMSMNGNVIYHQMVAANTEAYHKAEDAAKQKILLEIWTSITERGGRFLLQIENAQIWEKLELQPALHKISQAFDFLCAQYYTTKDCVEGMGSKSKSSPHDEDLFFGWMFDKKRCFNLLHCKGTGDRACW